MAKPLTKSILIKLIKEQIEDSIEARGLGQGTVTKGELAKAEREKLKQLASDDDMDGVTGKERAIQRDIEEIIDYIAEKDDLNRYKSSLEGLLSRLLNRAKQIAAKEEEIEAAKKEKEELQNQEEV